LLLQNKCEYAGFNEFGTKKMPPHPFMRPAVYNHLPEIEDIAGGTFRRGLK
jgi:HK97 gp10 family phage protein